MDNQNEDKYSRYDSPSFGQEEQTFQQPGPLDKINEFVPVIKQNAKKIGIIIIAGIILYLALDFFVLSNKQFTINLTDTEGNPIQANTLNIYSGDNPKPLFSASNQTSYQFSMKPGNYRIEAKATNYKTLNNNIEATADNPTIAMEMEKNLNLEITALNFPSELYQSQQTEAIISITNKGTETQEAELAFEGDLKTMGKNIYSEPETITIGPGNTEQATIKISVPSTMTIKDKTNGDKKKGIIRIKYLSESKEEEFTLYPLPEFDISPKNITATITADGENHFIKDITIKNKNNFAATNISFAVDAEEQIKNYFFFQPEATIESLGAKGTNLSTGTVKLWANVPIGTEQGNISPNITIDAGGIKLPPITMVISITPVKLDFVASASRETINIPKEGNAYKELIGETIRLQNKGVVTIQNIDLSADVACRDNWISFPQGSHIDSVAKGTTEEVALRVTAPASAEANKAVTCQITVLFENPVNPAEKKQQVVNLFLVPKD